MNRAPFRPIKYVRGRSWIQKKPSFGENGFPKDPVESSEVAVEYYGNTLEDDICKLADSVGDSWQFSPVPEGTLRLSTVSSCTEENRFQKLEEDLRNHLAAQNSKSDEADQFLKCQESLKKVLKVWSEKNSEPLPEEIPVRSNRRKRKRAIVTDDTDVEKAREERRKQKNRITAERSRKRKQAKLERVAVDNKNIKNANNRLMQLVVTLYMMMNDNVGEK